LHGVDEQLRRVARLSVGLHHVKHLRVSSGHASRASRDVGYLRASNVEIPAARTIRRYLERSVTSP
jgi:hypothetical protein